MVMNNCEKIKELLVLYSEGVLDTELSSRVEWHLESCLACRKEAEAIAKIRGWLSDPALFAPNQDYEWQILPQALAAKAKSTSRVRRWLPANFGSRGWALSLAATVILCFGLVWMTHRHLTAPQVALRHAAPGNEAFLDRIQVAYAREATAQYLSECQDLLLDVMRAERNCAGDLYDVSMEVAQARQLLQRKRMLEAELTSPQVVHAKDLCDELEKLLVDLSTSDKCESHDRIQRMERYIQREKLLLRINVLQSELS
jgi:predicted anti-sigma-YlaC factor YlaD